MVLAERASEPLLKDCTAEDFETVVQAKLVKALRRNPIKSTPVVSRMIRHVPRESVEKDSAQAFAEVVLPLVKHADESRRVAAIFVVKSFAKLLLAAIVTERNVSRTDRERNNNKCTERVGGESWNCDTISVIAESLVGVAVENEEDARIAIETIEILAARLKSEKQVEAKIRCSGTFALSSKVHFVQ